MLLEFGSPENCFGEYSYIPLRTLSQKVAFLVTITSMWEVSGLVALSCKPPSLIFYRNRLFRMPSSSFFLMVVSAFYLNEDIIPPSLLP